MEFIDAGIGAIGLVVETVGAVIAEIYPSEKTSMEEIYTRLQEEQDNGAIYCGYAIGNDGESYSFSTPTKIVVDIEGQDIGVAFAQYLESEYYGELTNDEIAALAQGTDEEYDKIRQAAQDYYAALAHVAAVLVHEAAHQVTSPRYSHAVAGDAEGHDFVIDVGLITWEAIIEEISDPVLEWIDELHVIKNRDPLPVGKRETSEQPHLP